MRFRWSKKTETDVRSWHRWFAWYPVRLNDRDVVWFEFVQRRLIVDDEGCWAGGFVSHWEYK